MKSDDHSKTFCPLPWVHLSMEPSGKVYTCCNTSEYEEVGNVNEQSFEEILENSNSKMVRQSFKNAIMPKQCKICVEAQKWGQISLRESSLRKFSDITSEQKPSLKYLSLRFSNQCNLACRICNPHLSTAWYSDAKKLGHFVPEGIVRAYKDPKVLEKFIGNIPRDIEILYFAGGEPFLTLEFYQILEKLIADDRVDTELILNTNMTTLSLGKRNGLELLSKFKKVSLDLSIDGIDKNGEYSRSGFNWNVTKGLINKIKNEYPNVRLNLFPTISIFNIFHIEELLNYFLENKILSPKNIRLNPLLSPEQLSFINLPKQKKEEIKINLQLYIKYLYTANYGEQEVLGLVTQLKGIISMLDEADDSNLLKKFVDETKKIDALRSVKIVNSIPELQFLFSS